MAFILAASPDETDQSSCSTLPTPSRLAFLLVHLLLFMHLRACVSVLATQVDREETKEYFPWMGLYGERLAQITTALSVTLIPALSIVSLLIRFRSRADVLLIAAACVLGGVAITLGCLASRDIHKLRQELCTLMAPEDGG
jgi:hypothetical protein